MSEHEKTVDRAFAAAAEHDYSGPESRALLRLALDADHETGENCVTSLARVHEFAGYSTRDREYRSARRAIDRFVEHGVLREDFAATGIGRVFTVCPTGPWSGEVAPSTTVGRKLAARRTRDTKTSGVHPGHDPGHPDVRGTSPTPDSTPDTTPDVKTSSDQKTIRPASAAEGIVAVLSECGVGPPPRLSDVERELEKHPDHNGVAVAYAVRDRAEAGRVGKSAFGLWRAMLPDLEWRKECDDLAERTARAIAELEA